MIVVHRVFRRESALLPRLIAAVPAGSSARARLLVGHLRDYAEGLHQHHTGEDELLWPLMLARVDLEADVVLRMEGQHEKVAANWSGAEPRGRWASSITDRDALVAALREHAVLLVELLGDEETMLLPLAAQHVTQAEWNRMGEQFEAHTPKGKMLFFLGALLEEATPAEQTSMMRNVPAVARLVWRLVGRRQYGRRIRAIRGQA
jgi:hypothetical protein